MSTSRQALEEAFSDLEASDAPERTPLEPIVDDAPADLAPLNHESKDSTIDAPLETSEEAPPKAEKPRKMIKDGKYVPVVEAPKPEEEAKLEEEPKTAKIAAKDEKAPFSWKPELRDKFKKLPQEVKNEILRRESDLSKAMNESAASRKFHQEFAATVRPFEAIIAGSGVSSMQAVRNLMTTAATLQTGTPAQRASTVANIIKAYGVDIATLDSILAGRAPKPGQVNQDEIERIVAQRLAPVQQYMSRAQQQEQARAQAITQESTQTIDSFASDPKNEYYEDVREDMADFLEQAAQRGRVMTIQQAYHLATNAHPEISKLVARKSQAERLRTSQQTVERARRAASSASPGSPAMGGASRAQPKGRRDALSKAWDDLAT